MTPIADNRELMDVYQKVRIARGRIDSGLPPGSVYPKHNEQGHFYGVPSGDTYPSVTGIISYVKDESVQTFQMNEALRHVEANLHRCVGPDGKFDMMKAIDVLYEAKKAPRQALDDAGDIGKKIHDRREKYFQAWIDSDMYQRPDITQFYDKDMDDPRLVSAMRALDAFCDETHYIPVRTEVLVYSDKYKLAGTLDDVGFMRRVTRKFSDNCEHTSLVVTKNTTFCRKCNGRYTWDFVLMDLKSSNQFKDSYFYQVALYYLMFSENTGMKPNHSFILKVSKENGTYSMEDLGDMKSLISGAKKIISAAEAVRKVKHIRATTNGRPTLVL